MQEMELEPRVKPLTYKVKGISRESPSQKASHVLDIDLRNHWSTATNTKEWILLELDGTVILSRFRVYGSAIVKLHDLLRRYTVVPQLHSCYSSVNRSSILEPCLLSQIRIYNKSVLEWEISVGLRYKPETFIKVRPRCEAPRRDMVYPMNYTACRYVRISCLRGNPIAIFFIQLIGVPVNGLEPEFQPVINHLLPQIISHKQDTEDIHLQLLQDMTNRLVTFLPQLEADLNSFQDAPESSLRFLAMLAGPFYPILHVLIERETAKSAGTTLDIEASKNSLPSPALTVSSNFEPRRSRPTIPTFSHTSTVFRPDVILLLLRKAYKDSHLGIVCRMASRVLLKLNNQSDATSAVNTDYSELFGEEFCVTDDNWDFKYLQLLDIKAVEEGILHVLFACASQPLLCSKLVGNSSEFWSTLPLIQALLPALGPNFNSSGQVVDDSFSAWRQPFVQHALSQIVVTSTSPMYRPLLHGCSGYLSSFSPSHAKAACVLIDLCTGVLGPWLGQVIAKVDLAVELVENLLGVIHGARNAISESRAALKYIILALSGHVDDVLSKYKQVKHQILFLLQILEPFLDPALKTTIPFGDLSPIFHDTHHHNCHVALNLIRTAVSKSNILPSLESQWRRNSVPPIVLLSILEPHMQLPPNTDLAKSVTVNPQSPENSPQEDEDSDTFDDVSVLFAPIELNNIVLTNTFDPNTEEKILVRKLSVKREENLNAIEYSKLQTECLHLMSYSDCELWASEFKCVAFDLHSQSDVTSESHNAAIDALLLAAECYVNPFFMMSFKENITKINNHFNFTEIRKILEKSESNLETTEKKRDKIVLEVLLEAAKLDQKYQNVGPQNEDDDVMKFSVTDTSNMDAITLVRQNQDLLFKFLVNSLTKEVKEQHSMREILLQSLVFLLQSATKLYCPPGQIIDIILKSSEYLNEILVSYCHKGKLELELVKVHEIERHWMLIQKLVVASSGDSEGHFSNLVPSSSWVNKISSFSSSLSPLVRFIGWMAVSRNCKQFKKERLVLTSELTQLTTLLTIFTDELAVIDDVSGQHVDRSFRVTYPEISQFFPNLKKQFKQFGENILEAVGLQVRSLPSSVVPDLLCWFSDLCSHDDVIISSRSFLSKNTKAVVLYVLEAIVTEHMEAMVPEIPRVVQVLQSLCKTSYADVAFLDSVLKLLNPIISYSLKKASKEEGGTSFEFESLCFDEIFSNIKNEITSGEEYSKAPTIFVLASVFLDLSLKRKLEILKSLIFWADFATFEPTNSFHDYLSAFQTVLETSRSFLVERLQVTGVIPLEKNESDSGFLKDAYQVFDEMPSDISNHFSVEETMEFSKVLETLLSKLNPTIELCWKLHFQLAKKLTATSAECFVYSKSLSLLVSQNSTSPWIKSLEHLAETLLVLQENSLWEVSSEILNCILEIKLGNLDDLITPICSSMKTFSSNAPKVTWRLQTDKWLSKLLKCGTHFEPPLTDLLSSLMSHIEPEQRFIALKHLGNLVDKGEMTILPSLVSNMWDKIVVMAKSDVSDVLRTRAMAVLVKCVPFAEREKLQCVLNVVDGFLPCLVNLGQRTCEGPFVQLSLALVGNICLYCPTEDVGLIPESVWRNIESLGVLESGKSDDVVRSVCEALCKLKSEGDEAKEILKGVLTSDFSKEGDSDFGSTRETLLQVLANLTSVQSYFDFFSEKTDEKLLEIEEAEIEMDLIQKEQSVQESSSDSTDWRKLPFLANYEREDKRLEEIKDHIQSLEKAKLKEEIIARRQKKLLIRRARQKYLEETALHEAELLQELDRERAAETEKEIERQKLLAIERAKTRELQHSLDMEKEKKTQRELQRELEQAEARPPSRREYSSGPSSRPRERYRERDNNGRSPNEPNSRPSGPTGDFTNPTILSGARQFSGQPPTLLQPRDRQDDSSYEENFDGSRDSGDTGSVGEPDIMMALEGQSGNFGSGQRNVSRGNKSRQMVERRERDGRREGKWERRH